VDGASIDMTGNYNVTLTVANVGEITPKSLTATITVADKVYDGSDSAIITEVTLNEVENDDIVNADFSTATANFVNAEVGNGKDVTAKDIIIGGTDADNYSYDGPATGIGNILQIPMVVYVDGNFTTESAAAAGHTLGYDAFSTIQEGINAVDVSGTVNVLDGTYTVNSSINVDESVIITTDASATIVSATLDTPVFNVTADNVTIEKFNITTSLVPFSQAGAVITGSETSGALVLINAQNATIAQNTIYANEISLGGMATWTARGITLQTGSATISGNTIYGVRNGIVVRYGNTASITNNVIFDTKGGIMNYTSNQADADTRTTTGNSWASTVSGLISHNEWDIVWNSATYVPDYQQSVLDLSVANNNAYVVDRRDTNPDAMALGNRSHIFISPTGATSPYEAKGNFNEPFATLALGIDAVVAGGTVNVAAGTYAESPTISRAVTLNGANIDINPTTGNRVSETILNGQLTVESEQVTINGLSITNPSGTMGIYLHGVGNVTIENNILDTIGTTFSGGSAVQAIYVYHGTGDISNITIQNNRFTNSGSTINGSSNKAIFVGDTSSQSSLISNVTISDNYISGINANSTNYHKGAYGILVNHTAPSIYITNNQIANLTGWWSHAIGLEGNTANALVTGNTISNIVSSGNTNNDSIGVYLEDNASASTVTIHSNKFEAVSVNYGVAANPNTIIVVQ